MRCVFLSACLLVGVLYLSSAALAKEDDDAGNPLAEQLDKLGLGDVAEDAVKNAFSGGAAGNIPLPDAPASADAYDDDIDDDDSEPDYLRMRDQKEIYEKTGDVIRLNTANFDEQVFNGKQEVSVIAFYTKWCRDCQLHGPSLRALGRRYRDDPKVKVFAVNQEGNYDLSSRFDTDPGEPSYFYTKGTPQLDSDVKYYDGDVSFASLLQFTESRGTDMVKQERQERELYPEDETAVVPLNWDNFNQTVFDSKKNVLVQFYAGWSEFCVTDSGNYTVLAARLNLTHPSNVVIAGVDTDKHAKLADRFDVQGLPAYWFANTTAKKDTDLVKYTGDHNGAMVVEEATDFVTSDGQKVPPGMKDDHPIHMKPWEQIQKDMAERQKKEDTKNKEEHTENVKRMEERKEKMAKKKALKDKAAATKADSKDKKDKDAGAKHDSSEL